MSITRSGGAALAAIAWTPLALISVFERVGGGSIEPVLLDPAVHARTLIAIPSFVAAALLLDRQAAGVVDRLRDQQLADAAAVARLAKSAERWSRSRLAELVLLGLAIAIGQAHFWGAMPSTGLLAGRHLGGVAPGPASAWYAWVALPAFAFAGARFLYRWLVWTGLLACISRLPLATEPTHPDLCGGLCFLSGPTRALAGFAFGSSVVAAAAWSGEIAFGRAQAMQFTETFTLFACVLVALALAPLALFGGHLRRTRQRGLVEHGRLGLIYARRFRTRWIDREPGPKLLGTEDIQSLADLAASFRAIRNTRVIPCGAYELGMLLAALLLPVLPLMLTVMPLSQLIPKLARTLLGGSG